MAQAQVIALDTNVVVRLVTADEPAQLAAARRVMSSGPIYLTKSVLLETEWVLRYSYELRREVIGVVLRKLIGARNLEVEDLEAVVAALSWHHRGMDFADALHLASSHGASRFATFDRSLAAAAAALKCLPRVELLTN